MVENPLYIGIQMNQKELTIHLGFQIEKNPLIPMRMVSQPHADNHIIICTSFISSIDYNFLSYYNVT